MDDNNVKEMKMEMVVSSKAVVKYEEHAAIPSYIELDKDTDLNHPPPNWLRDNLIGKFSYQGTRKTEPFDYHTLLMAGSYPEIIGEVDVVAGANIIKKLLKMPFSDSSLSMSVHRIGKTLLLSQLDIPALLHSQCYANNDNLDWLRNLYCEARGIPIDSEFHPKKKNKEESQMQLITSKFLHHSIEAGTSKQTIEEKPHRVKSKNLQTSVVNIITPDEKPGLTSSNEALSKALSTVVVGNNNANNNNFNDVVLSTNGLPAILNNTDSNQMLQEMIQNADFTSSLDVVKPINDITNDWSSPHQNNEKTLIHSPLKKSSDLIKIDSAEQIVRANDLTGPVETSERVPLRQSDIDPNDMGTGMGTGFQGGVKSDSVFLRDVLWTFEDITMLVGSDLPIFGGGKYPAVSLRLSDSSKPINILTGIDYWLDNLMCNVPELIMCFHLNGIVQRYEKIKTSDLPDMEGGSFSPKVIKDVAQNILSFLKANCTKEGHTYWLFKSSKDDVIKLYDLTSICAEKTFGKAQDPFSVSVAVLLYNIARNMYTAGEINSRNVSKLRSLLKNCISLLGNKERPDVSLLANFLLLELNYDQDEENNETNSFEDDSEETYSTDDDFNENEQQPSSELITTVSVEALGKPPMMVHSSKENNNNERSVIVAVNEESRCKNMLSFIASSLKSINILLYMCKVAEISQGVHVREPENLNTQIKSVQHEKKHQSMLAFIQHDLKGVYLHNKKNLNMQRFSLVDNTQELSLGDVRIILLEKAVEVQLTLINISISKEKFGRALRLIQTCCYCMDNAKQMSNATNHNKYLSVEVLKLYGDVLTIMSNKNMNPESELEDFYALTDSDRNLQQLLEFVDSSQFLNINIKKMADSFIFKREELLNGAASSYEEAVTIIGDYQGEGNLSFQLTDLSRRLGNIRNELGVLYMNKAALITKQYGKPSDEEMAYWKRSYTLYEGAIVSFKTVSDRPNMALLYLNCAKLMHLCAQVYGNSSKRSIDDNRGPFTQQEKTYFNKSFEYYQKALSVLHSKRDYPVIWTNVSLELSGAYFNMAITMQENDIIKSTSDEKVIKEISSSYMKALHYSETVLKDCEEKQALVKHRMGSIHHRLALFYFNILKKQTSENGKKNYRSLSELHYKKIYHLVQPNLYPIDVLRVILEHMKFYEYIWKQIMSGKYLKSKLEMFYAGGGDSNSDAVHSVLLLNSLEELNKNLVNRNKTMISSDTSDVTEVKAMLSYLDTYINSTLKEVVKFLNDKKSKKVDFVELKVIKKVYEVVIRNRVMKNTAVADDNIVLVNLVTYIHVIKSIQDIK